MRNEALNFSGGAGEGTYTVNGKRRRLFGSPAWGKGAFAFLSDDELQIEAVSFVVSSKRLRQQFDDIRKLSWNACQGLGS